MSPWHSLSSSQCWQEKMCKLDPAFDTQLFMELQLSFSILLSCLEDWQRQKLHFAALVEQTWKQKAQPCVVLLLICLHRGIIYTMKKERKMEIGEVRLPSNLWVLSRVPAITASFSAASHSERGQPRHFLRHDKGAGQASLIKLCAATEGICNNQSYGTTKFTAADVRRKMKNKCRHFLLSWYFHPFNEIKVNCAPTQKVWKRFGNEFFMHTDYLMSADGNLLTFLLPQNNNRVMCDSLEGNVVNHVTRRSKVAAVC